MVHFLVIVIIKVGFMEISRNVLDGIKIKLNLNEWS